MIHNHEVPGSIPGLATRKGKIEEYLPFFFPLAMQYSVYIIYSERLDRYYTGSTQSVAQRIDRHNAGATKYTKAGRPWRLVYRKSFQTRAEAVKRETKIKSMKSRKYIEDLVRSFNLNNSSGSSDG